MSGLIKDFGPLPAQDGKMVRVLNGVDFTAHLGQVTALLGANGAGKTTTLECAQGLQRPDGGTVRLLGTEPHKGGPALRSRVGIMLQDGGLPPGGKPLALLRHIAGMYRSPRPVSELAERLGINEFAGTGIRRLSGGEKQRLALAAALVGDPEVLFLDEPSAGLDPQSRQIVFALIEELRADGMGIILTTHLMEDAQRLADYVFIVDAGRTVAHGTVAELTRAPVEDHSRELIFEASPGLTVPVPPGLTVTETVPGRYVVSGEIAPAHLTALATWWESTDILPASIVMVPRSLEDVFFDYSGRRTSP